MLVTLDEVMTPREAADRWGISLNVLHMKISRFRDSEEMKKLIKEGKAKYYKPENKQRGEWLFTVEAMELLYPKKDIKG